MLRKDGSNEIPRVINVLSKCPALQLGSMSSGSGQESNEHLDFMIQI